MIILELSLARLISLLFLSISTLGARDFSSAVSGFCQVFIVFFLSSPLVASAFGQHRKFPPHARKTSGTQGNPLVIAWCVDWVLLVMNIF